MAEIVVDWLHYDSRLPKRKRAELVCSSCHSKKVKCDLQTQTQAREEQGHTGHGTCSNCFSAGRDCVVYISKRKRHHSANDAVSAHGGNGNSNSNSNSNGIASAPLDQPTATSVLEIENGDPCAKGDTIQTLPTAPPTFTGPKSPSDAGDAIQANPTSTAQPLTIAQPMYPSQSHGHLDSRALPIPLTSSVLPAPQRRPSQAPSATTPQSHHSDSHIPGAATSRSNPIDVDTGFLHVYQVENQIDAERQELEAQVQQSSASTHHHHRHHPSTSSMLGSASDAQHAELTQIFAETYIEYCYPWCPVLDIPSIPADTLRSPLLANALALAASHIRPPLVPHDGPKTYYRRATSIFYNDEESDGLTTLQSIALFYWWAPRSPALARRHSSWWWTSVLIRHAQQMNFHREPGPNHPLRDVLQLGLRRRIWWTAFARERLTALCQSKPCIIDPEDCNIQELTLDDFPPDPRLQRKGEIFIHWVRLCGIIGRVAKTLSRSSSSPAAAAAAAGCEPDTGHVTSSLRAELISWVTSLPPHLQLPISSARTETGCFDRDIHQLHLPYLTTIIVLHLRARRNAGTSTTASSAACSSSDLPHALPPAILAASCIVRITRDVLSRGDMRFLMPITCWYSGTAFIALLQACRIREIATEAEEGLDVLTGMVEQLRGMWGSANVVREGFERLRRAHAADSGGGGAGGGLPVTQVHGQEGGSSGSGSGNGNALLLAGDRFADRFGGVEVVTGPGTGGGRPSSRPDGPGNVLPGVSAAASRNDGGPGDDDPDSECQWPALFPFVTRQTSRIAKVLLPGSEPGIPPTRFPSPDNLLFHETFIQDYQGFFDPFDPYLGFGDVVNGIL